nr:hypothetical protein [Tanacetum cinerariifolium]
MDPEEEDGDDEKSEGDSIEYPTSRGDNDADDNGDGDVIVFLRRTCHFRREKMAPKRARTTRANFDPTRTTTTTEPITQEAINNLIAQRVTEALAEHETQRNSVVNGDTSHTTGTGPITVRLTREYTYKDYQNYGLLKFNGTEGVIVSQEVAYAMPWKTMRQMMTAKYFSRGEVKKLEVKLWNLKVKGADITSYTLCFQELALFCGRMFPEESDEIERHVGRLPEMIQGNAPRSPEYVPDPIELEDHVPLHIPEHPEDLVPDENETYILEIGESSVATAARQPGPTMARSVNCSFVDPIETRFQDTERRMMTALEMVNMRVSYQVDVHSRESSEFYSRHHDAQEDRAAVRAEIGVLRRERLAYEQESIQIHEALTKSKAYSRTLEARVAVLETQAHRYEWQR